MVDVNTESTLLGWFGAAPAPVALVYTDIVASTDLQNRVRTNNYSQIFSAHEWRVGALAGQLQGLLVFNTGDGFLLAFRTIENAYRFGAALFADPGDPHLRVRIGLHFGAVTVHGHRVMGRNVNLCRRVMEHARHGEPEFWISGTTKAALETESPQLASEITWITSALCELRGFPGVQQLWRAM